MDNVVTTLAPSFFDWIFFILAGYKANYKSLDGFKIWPDQARTVELAALECLKKSPIDL